MALQLLLVLEVVRRCVAYDRLVHDDLGIVVWEYRGSREAEWRAASELIVDH